MRAAAFLLCATLGFGATAIAQEAKKQAAPEPDTGLEAKREASATRFMVAAANPLAADAGLAILKQGGSAVDAAIAVQMVLNLVEPQSSGLGGGAFILHLDRASGTITSYDGRETAPAAARPDRFLLPDGAPRNFDEAVASGLSVGVPGVLAALELAHGKHGKLPWARLFAPATKLARDGFPVSRRLNALLDWQGADAFDATARAYFFDAGGTARAVGSRLANPALATTFETIGAGGANAFYDGAIAAAIVGKVGGAGLAGDMTVADLAAYRARERVPFCVDYRRRRVCGMGPPSSGGPTVAMALKLIEPLELGRTPLEPDGVYLIAEAEKLAFADRDRYMADPDFVPFPDGLFDSGYLDGRRRLIDPARPIDKALPGEPPLKKARLYGDDTTFESAGTSHISIVDGDGNAVAMTTTIEAAFGSRMMVAGFLLNNELTDFAFKPADAVGAPVANRVEGGKRPRSSMAPTIVLDADGGLMMLTGSPGGSRIILYVLKSLVCVIDWGCTAQAAADAPNFGSRNGPVDVELGLEGARLAQLLKLKGQRVNPVAMTSGLHIIIARDGKLTGGADPRREGRAVGD